MTMSKTDNRLPKPTQPYPDWSRLIRAAWEHGMSIGNMDNMLLDTHCSNAMGNIMRTMVKRNEADRIRPSAFIACARQTYFAAQGYESANMPDNIGLTFSVGHLLHELSYAALKSAMPLCFNVRTEVDVALPKWWPDDYQRFNQFGHVDMLIEAEGDVSDYLPDTQPDTMLVDFKTMGSFSYRKHSKAIFGEDPDAFGYLAQLSVYADALGLLDNGAIIAGINRDSLTQPLNTRLVSPAALKQEAQRVRVAIEMAIEDQDPGEEFLVRHGEDAYFQCGRNGKPGYCPFREQCRAKPTRDYA
jgi:hypothetical protein